MESILKHSLWGDIPYRRIRPIMIQAMNNIIIMYGKMIHTVMKTETDLAVTYIVIYVIIGNMISSVVTSFENLVKILPMGLESKNNIFDLHIT